jgi:hypothetical protein
MEKQIIGLCVVIDTMTETFIQIYIFRDQCVGLKQSNKKCHIMIMQFKA